MRFALHSGGMQESNFSVQLIEREIEFENIDPEMLARKRQWNRLRPAVGFRIVNIVDRDGAPIFGGRTRCAAKRWITPSTATAAIDHDRRCDAVSLDELERIVI